MHDDDLLTADEAAKVTQQWLPPYNAAKSGGAMRGWRTQGKGPDPEYVKGGPAGGCYMWRRGALVAACIEMHAEPLRPLLHDYAQGMFERHPWPPPSDRDAVLAFRDLDPDDGEWETVYRDADHDWHWTSGDLVDGVAVASHWMDPPPDPTRTGRHR